MDMGRIIGLVFEKTKEETDNQEVAETVEVETEKSEK